MTKMSKAASTFGVAVSRRIKHRATCRTGVVLHMHTHVAHACVRAMRISACTHVVATDICRLPLWLWAGLVRCIGHQSRDTAPPTVDRRGEVRPIAIGLLMEGILSCVGLE